MSDSLWPDSCSTPGFPVLHYFPDFAQTHVHCVGDAIQPSHPLLSPSPSALNLSQHQGLCQWVGSLHQVAKVLELQLQCQSCCRKGDAFQGPKVGSCLTLKWIVQGDTCWPSKGLYWKGAPWQRAAGWGSPGECFATWLAVSGFMVMGLISGLSLANCSDSESFLVAHVLFSQDGHQWEGFWDVVGHVVSPFDLSWTLLVGDGLLVPCSLPGPPVVKHSCK